MEKSEFKNKFDTLKCGCSTIFIECKDGTCFMAEDYSFVKDKVIFSMDIKGINIVIGFVKLSKVAKLERGFVKEKNHTLWNTLTKK